MTRCTFDEMGSRVKTEPIVSVKQGEDFCAWCYEQAGMLRQLADALPKLDCEQIAEELEGMARSEAHALTSFLEVLLVHILKWLHEPRRRSRSWRASIGNARSEIRGSLADSPSLGAQLPILIERAYERARRSAGVEMELEEHQWERLSPPSCPWDFDTIMSDF